MNTAMNAFVLLNTLYLAVAAITQFKVAEDIDRPDRINGRACIYACLTISTEISTAGVAPLFSSQWVVFLSSGHPTPGP